MLKRWLKYAIITWLAIIQSMAPLVHAHEHEHATMGVHLHALSQANKVTNQDGYQQLKSQDIAAIGIGNAIIKDMSLAVDGDSTSTPFALPSFFSLFQQQPISIEWSVSNAAVFPFFQVIPRSPRAPPYV